MTIGQTVEETWPFLIFFRWRRPLSWILKSYLTAGPVGKDNMHQRAKFRVDRLNRCGDMTDF